MVRVGKEEGRKERVGKEEGRKEREGSGVT